VLEERRNLLAPVAQRRQVERQDLEAVEEILAKAALCDQAIEVGVGGGDDADVDLDRLAFSHHPTVRGECMRRSLWTIALRARRALDPSIGDHRRDLTAIRGAAYFSTLRSSLLVRSDARCTFDFGQIPTSANT
jgi:hypothetical protein